MEIDALTGFGLNSDKWKTTSTCSETGPRSKCSKAIAVQAINTKAVCTTQREPHDLWGEE